MRLSYGWLWFTILAFTLAFELLSPFWSSPVAWTALFMAGVGVECVALGRRTKGDTLSELMWSFVGNHLSRKILVGAFALYIAERFLMASTDMISDVVPRATLAVGFAAWAVVHFVTKGRHG